MARAIDPVCGMTVETDTAAATMQYNDQTYHFCSTQCAAAFRANPERYVGGEGEGEMERHDPPFTNEGGLTAPRFGAAGSGGAENEPTPERHRR